MTGEMMRRLEPVARSSSEPDGVLVYGDTNSTLAGGGRRRQARPSTTAAGRGWRTSRPGLRSFNRRMPEERNRVVADHLADLLLAPTPAAMANLGARGPRRARRAGRRRDGRRARLGHAARRRAPARGRARSTTRYVLLTLHRAENVDDPERLAAHPRRPRRRAAGRSSRSTRAPARALDRAGLAPAAERRRHRPGRLPGDGRARGVTPRRSPPTRAGVQKEAYLAGVPCITLRSETEWVETVEAGWNRVVDADPSALARRARRRALHAPRPPAAAALRRRGRPLGVSLPRSSDTTTARGRRATRRRRRPR